MKIEKDELIELSNEPIDLFYQGFKSKATKISYTRKLKKILCEYLEDILDGTFENRASQLVHKAQDNQKEAMIILLTLSKMLKDRTQKNKNDRDYLNPSSFNNFFKPIKKLFDMNGVSVVWKRIYATYPENDNLSESRGYTKAEIQTMLKFSQGSIDVALILVSSSSGIRVGGLEGLKWGDIVPIYKIEDNLVLEIIESQVDIAQVVCAMFITYRHTKEEYPAFITLEAYNSIINYRKTWIREIGKEPKDEDILFKKSGIFVRKLGESGIRSRINRIVEKSGIRQPLVKGKRRHEVPTMNGFRRFFNKVNKETLSRDSPLATLIRKEYMMNHVGLVKTDRNYFKTHVMELVEDYLTAVSNLTISNEERLKADNFRLRKEKSELETTKQELEEVRKDIRLIKKYAKLIPKDT